MRADATCGVAVTDGSAEKAVVNVTVYVPTPVLADVNPAPVVTAPFPPAILPRMIRRFSVVPGTKSGTPGPILTVPALLMENTALPAGDGRNENFSPMPPLK